MISIIIYVSDLTYINNTLKSIYLHTHYSLIREIIICNDTGIQFNKKKTIVISSNKIGYSKACNLAINLAKGEYLIFIKDTTKVSKDWVYPILKTIRDNRQSLVSPIIHTLDVNYWSFEPSCWRRFGWRWDLNIYNKPNNTNESPAISNYCIACTKLWMVTIGCFDDNMLNADGDSSGIELAIRSWLFGGKVLISQNSTIAVRFQQKITQASISNLARIVEIWFPKYANQFYELAGQQHNIGKLNNLLVLQYKQILSSDKYLANLQPELYYLYNLRSLVNNKTIAIVSNGPSIDYIDRVLINRHDVVIGIDDVCELIECDYISTNSTNIINNYKSHAKFIVPNVLSDRTSNKIIPTNSIIPNSYQYELAEQNVIPTNITQSFINTDDITLTTIHVALFLKPKSIVIYGYDNKFIKDKSHTTLLEQYVGGKILSNTQYTEEQFVKSEMNLKLLGKLAESLNIPLLRLTHV